MPQGRKKTPFSGKQKKSQLFDKRERKRLVNEDEETNAKTIPLPSSSIATSSRNNLLSSDVLINVQHDQSNSSKVNRYALQFRRETKEEISKRKELAAQTLPKVDVRKLEVHFEDIFILPELGLPKRPRWSNTMSVLQLEVQEQRYFREYVQTIESEYSKYGEMGYFELNLETWRQLWRVLEMSDIVLLITDIRYPIFHFPPGLYEYVVNELKKEIILVVNKVDLVPASLVIAWIAFLEKKFPKVNIVPFASYSGMKYKQTGSKRGQRIGKLRMASKSAQCLLDVCEQIVKNEVNLSSWRQKIIDELHEEVNDDIGDDIDEDDEDDNFKPLTTGEQKYVEHDFSYYEDKRYKDGILTIGCVGHPNVGKSSLLNAIMGKKVVSVSRTPGHTKHFQTIFLTETVKLCDCPGLVFPSLASKEIQTLMGCFPIAQLREPYSAISYLAERVDISKILNLTHPTREHEWSSFDICEAFARKRGFYTAKSGRPDVYRAANCLLRMALDGRTLTLAFHPPNFLKEYETIWSMHSDIRKIEHLQWQTCQPEFDDNYKQIIAAVTSAGKLAASDNSETKSNSDQSNSESDDGDDVLKPIVNKFALLDQLDT